MTIKGGTFSNTKGQMVGAWDNAVTTITAGTFTSATSCISVAGSATVKVKGGTFKHTKVGDVKASADDFILNDGATLSISGGTFTNSKAGCALLYNLGKTTISGNASLKSSGKTGDSVINEGGTLTIKGGTITKSGSENVPLSVYGGTVKISGGTIKATNGWEAIYANSGTLKVTGGKLSVKDNYAITVTSSVTYSIGSGVTFSGISNHGKVNVEE
ncbi:MAG: hypothetical protein LUG93_02185 [Lachnospiraceae bacterium]|nr:hypothetical protein [Lachnospiraceae bacterium]